MVLQWSTLPLQSKRVSFWVEVACSPGVCVYLSKFSGFDTLTKNMQVRSFGNSKLSTDIEDWWVETFICFAQFKVCFNTIVFVLYLLLVILQKQETRARL